MRKGSGGDQVRDRGEGVSACLARDLTGVAGSTHHHSREGADRGGGRQGDSVRGEGAVESRVEGCEIIWEVEQAMQGDDCVDEDYGGITGGNGFRRFLRWGVGWGLG